jgi:hypothetical protein
VSNTKPNRQPAGAPTTATVSLTKVQTVFPSKKGNYRVKAFFSDRSVKHFYMDPTGNLYIPDKHKAKAEAGEPLPLDDKELDWCLKTWKKGNAEVKGQTFTKGPVFKMASALAISMRTEENKKAQVKVLPERPAPKTNVQTKVRNRKETNYSTSKGGNGTLGSVFGGLFKQIKAGLIKTA